MSVRRRLVLLVASFHLTGCAALYRVQLGDVDGRRRGEPISIKVDDTTIDFREAGKILKAVGRANHARGVSGLGNSMSAYTTFFQFGPRTGTPTFSDTYARNVAESLQAACKGGYVTDVISVREARDYPVVKGEIVRVDARCVRR